MLRDPVCGKKMNPNKAYAQIAYKSEMYYLCCPLCQSEFEKEPDAYIQKRNGNGKGKRNNH
jgi:YHS domain-containing protein